jgi:hypothetical protein
VCSALAVPGERHGDDAAEGFRQQARAAPMGQPVRLAGDEHIGYGVEQAEARPHQQHGRDVALGGNGIDDATEQDRFGNGDHRKHDVGGNHGPDAHLVGAEIAEGPSVDLKQRHEMRPFRRYRFVQCSECTFSPFAAVLISGSGKSSSSSSKFHDGIEILRDYAISSLPCMQCN